MAFSHFAISFFSIKPETLEIKFPNLFVSSPLCLSIKATSEKSPSSPKTASLSKKYLAESGFLVIAINSSMLIIFPRDFDIFSLCLNFS